MIDILNDKAKAAIMEDDNWTRQSLDEPTCVICGKRIIDDVPLRLFSSDTTWEIDFHIDCAIDEVIT